VLGFIIPETGGAGIGGDDERTVEERGVERPHDVEVGPLIHVAAHARLGQL
jgi:hypothetical protein